MRKLIHINEYLIKKKIDKVRGTKILYTPKTKEELIANIKELLDQGETNLNCIDTSKIKDMSGLFYDEIPYSHNIDFDVSEWDVSNVENMNMMFSNCHNFNCDLSRWNVSKVKHMDYMFFGCKKFDCNLSNWDVSNIKYMSYMFSNCEKLKGKEIENWDVSSVVNMTHMFHGCSNLNCDLSNWDVSNVVNMDGIFDGCTSLKNKPSWYK